MKLCNKYYSYFKVSFYLDYLNNAYRIYAVELVRSPLTNKL